MLPILLIKWIGQKKLLLIIFLQKQLNALQTGLLQQPELFKLYIIKKSQNLRNYLINNCWIVQEIMETKVVEEDLWNKDFGILLIMESQLMNHILLLIKMKINVNIVLLINMLNLVDVQEYHKEITVNFFQPQCNSQLLFQ